MLCVPSEVEQSYKHFNHYTVTLKSRNSQVGVVELLIRNLIETKIVDELTLVDSNIKSLFMKVKCRICLLFVVSIYRPPRGNLSKFIDKLKFLLTYNRMNSSNFPIHIWGDIKIDILKCSENRKKNNVSL